MSPRQKKAVVSGVMIPLSKKDRRNWDLDPLTNLQVRAASMAATRTEQELLQALIEGGCYSFTQGGDNVYISVASNGQVHYGVSKLGHGTPHHVPLVVLAEQVITRGLEERLPKVKA